MFRFDGCTQTFDFNPTFSLWLKDTKVVFTSILIIYLLWNCYTIIWLNIFLLLLISEPITWIVLKYAKSLRTYNSMYILSMWKRSGRKTVQSKFYYWAYTYLNKRCSLVALGEPTPQFMRFLRLLYPAFKLKCLNILMS